MKMRLCMKKCGRSVMAVLLLFTIVLGTFSSTVSAQGEWREDIYRVYMSSSQLSDAERDSLDELACDFVATWKLDMVLMVIGKDDYSDELGETGLGFYDHNEFGYGENHDGVVACFDEDNMKIALRTVGRAKNIFPQSFIDHYEDYLPTLHEKYGDYGVLYGAYYSMNDYLLDNYGTETDAAMITGKATGELENGSDNADINETNSDITDALKEDDSVNPSESGGNDNSSENDSTSQDRSLQDSAALDFERNEYGLPIRYSSDDKPCWYPDNVDSFVEYHDSEIPRVVDIADIFTPEEEKALTDKISSVSEETGKDVVIFTDTQTYGFTREIYCYDFYDFCGYGTGDKYDGMCLFVCMDPNNRGWVASATGVVEDMYTEKIANEMDDELFPYMKAGNYGEGVLDWVGNLYNLYTRGVPFYAEWIPEDKSSFVRTNNPDIPRIYDSADIFSENEEKALQERAESITNDYGVDVVVHTTRHTYDMSDEEYADAFYRYNGYGIGENYDGLLLTICVADTNRTVVRAYGKGNDKLTKVNYDRIFNQSDIKIYESEYVSATNIFLTNVNHMLKTGRVNKTLLSWLGRLIIAIIAGWIVGGISLSRAKSNMKTVTAAVGATSYLNGNKSIVPVSDTYVTQHVTKRKIVRSSSSSSSGSSSSSRSSYSSHSSGSSGRSHTSSSRNF